MGIQLLEPKQEEPATDSDGFGSLQTYPRPSLPVEFLKLLPCLRKLTRKAPPAPAPPAEQARLFAVEADTKVEARPFQVVHEVPDNGANASDRLNSSNRPSSRSSPKRLLRTAWCVPSFPAVEKLWNDVVRWCCFPYLRTNGLAQCFFDDSARCTVQGSLCTGERSGCAEEEGRVDHN